MGDMKHKHNRRVDNLEAELNWLSREEVPTKRQIRRERRIRDVELPKARRNKAAHQ